MTFKKIIAILLSVVLLLCLAACGKEEEAPASQETAAPNATTAATKTPMQANDPDASGMLYLSMDAEIMINYDENSLVKSVEPANEIGQEILEKTPIAEGTACDAAVAELVKATVEASTSDLKVVLIKQAYGSTSPSDSFLDDIRADAEAAAANRTVVVVDVASLTENGYLPSDTIETIFKASIGDENAKISVTEELISGIYYVSHENGEITSNYTVDADTGRITYQEDEPVLDLEDTEPTEPYDAGAEVEVETEPYIEEFITEPVLPDETDPIEPEVTVFVEETVAETEPVEATEN